MDPFELIFQDRYEEAIKVYTRRINQASEPDEFDLGGRGMAFLCLGKYDEALRDLVKADDSRRNKLIGSPGCIEDIAITLWMKGEKAEAIKTARSAVDGLIKGEIEYADLAGGVGPGLLLWYMAVSLGDSDNKSYALKYLKQLSKKSKIKYWPGPLAKFVLGSLIFQDVLKEIGKSSNINKLKKKSRKDMLLRRRLLSTIFYQGVKKLDEGDNESFSRAMVEITELKNTAIELEWYLARYEKNKIYNKEN